MPPFLTQIPLAFGNGENLDRLENERRFDSLTEASAILNTSDSIKTMNLKNWLVALMIWSGLFLDLDTGFAQIWFRTGPPIQHWTGIAMSADGRRQVAVTADGGVYTSKNFGVNWSLTSAPSSGWGAVASSADGNTLVVLGAGVYTSTNGGDTWIFNESLPTAVAWVSATISADGRKIAAVNFFETLAYTSTNSGRSWCSNNIANPENHQIFGYPRYIAGSADGTKLAVATLGGTIYVSINSGVTWDATTAPVANWTCIASSKDGDRLVATAADTAESTGGIFTSSDSGATWQLTSATNPIWYCLACSANGKKTVAGAGGWTIDGPMFTSANFGKTWRPAKIPDTTWYSVASSANGNVLAAVAFGGGIYIGLR